MGANATAELSAYMGRGSLPSKFEDAAIANGEAASSTLQLKYWN
jgi:hypothetical protein